MRFGLDSFRRDLVLSVQEVSLPLQVRLVEPTGRDGVNRRMERAWEERAWEDGTRGVRERGN